MTAPQSGRFPWRRYAALLAAIVLLALLPLISVYLAYSIADATGCRVDEAGVYPCIVNGTDIGSYLAFMGLLGWLMLASLPLGAIALCLWLAALLIHIAIGYMRARKEKPQP